MLNNNTWIVVADAASALIFEKPPKQSHLDEAPKLTVVPNDADADLEFRDQPGRTFDRIGSGRHGKEPGTNPARHQIERHAKEIVHRLESGRNRQAFDELVLVAPPQLLGDLRKCLSEPLKKLVVAEIDKDLTHLPIPEIDSHLGAVLRPYEH